MLANILSKTVQAIAWFEIFSFNFGLYIPQANSENILPWEWEQGLGCFVFCYILSSLGAYKKWYLHIVTYVCICLYINTDSSDSCTWDELILSTVFLEHFEFLQNWKQMCLFNILYPRLVTYITCFLGLFKVVRVPLNLFLLQPDHATPSSQSAHISHSTLTILAVLTSFGGIIEKT